MAGLAAKDHTLRHTPSLLYNNLSACPNAAAYIHRDEVHVHDLAKGAPVGPLLSGATAVLAFGDKLIAATKEEAVIFAVPSFQKVSSIAFSEPDPFLSRGIAVFGDDAFIGHHNGSISRLSLKEGKEVGSFAENKESITSVAAGKVGGEEVVVGCDMGGSVVIYAMDGKVKGKADVVAGDTPTSVAVGADLIAVGYGSGKVRLFNSSGKKRVEIAAHARWINAISFDPSGKMLATTSEDQLLQLWGVEGGKVVPKGHRAFPNCLLTGVSGVEGKFYVTAYDSNGLWEVGF